MSEAVNTRGAAAVAASSATGNPAADSASGPGLNKVVRLLRVSGRRLVDCGGEWRVLSRSNGRKRPLLTVSAADVERLVSGKQLVATPGGYVLPPEQEPAPDEKPAAGPWIYGAAGPRAAQGRWGGFARLAELARQGRGPLSLRQALAGLRLIEDAELATRDPMLTMNWDAAPADRNTRSGRQGGLQAPALRAANRIDRIRARLGKRDFAVVHAACVERLPLKTLEHRFGLKRLAARKLLPEALETAAEVYDGQPSARRVR